MSNPALIFAINLFYHAFFATSNFTTNTAPIPEPQHKFWSGANWEALAIALIAGVILTVVVPLSVQIHRHGFRPTFHAVVSFLRLYWSLSSIGMSRFHRSRDDYKTFRKGGKTIAGYISTAKSSLKIVSFSLITGVQYEELCKALDNLVHREHPVTIDISLLDPRKADLTRAVAPSYDKNAQAFCGDIHTAIQLLFKLKNNLRKDARHRLRIHIHKAIPFGSAILIDSEDEKKGRIQIETKAYKSVLDLSWGFELRAGGRHSLYNTLVQSYTQLIEDGEELHEPLPDPSECERY